MSAQLLVYFTFCSRIRAKIKDKTVQRKMWVITFSPFSSSPYADKTLKNQNVLDGSRPWIQDKKIRHWCFAVMWTEVDLSQVLSSIWKQPLISWFSTEESSHFKLYTQRNRGKLILAACLIGITTRTILYNEDMKCSHYPQARECKSQKDRIALLPRLEGTSGVYPVPRSAQSRVS